MSATIVERLEKELLKREEEIATLISERFGLKKEEVMECLNIPTEKEQKKGRPKKSKKEVENTTGIDLFAELGVDKKVETVVEVEVEKVEV